MTLRPLVNEVILSPVNETAQFSAGGLLLVNKYKRPTLKFKVLAVGPAGYVQRTKANGRKKFVFRSPEVEVGDMVLCRAILEGGIAKAHFEDGTGRVVVSAENIIAKWNE